jgi:hypothetical protein
MKMSTLKAEAPVRKFHYNGVRVGLTDVLRQKFC